MGDRHPTLLCSQGDALVPAVVDVEEAIANLGLPDDTWSRIGRSLRLLEDSREQGGNQA